MKTVSPAAPMPSARAAWDAEKTPSDGAKSNRPCGTAAVPSISSEDSESCGNLDQCHAADIN